MLCAFERPVKTSYTQFALSNKTNFVIVWVISEKSYFSLCCIFILFLVNNCFWSLTTFIIFQVEFESRSASLELNGGAVIEKQHDNDGDDDEDERRRMAKRKMLGNIKFIGELGKLEMLSENILHLCIKQLLVKRKGEDNSEDLECLCQIMRTCGRILDTDKGEFAI